MVNNVRHIYIHDTNRSYLGIGYNNIKGDDNSIFSKNMVGQHMNAADRKQLEIAHLKLDDVRQDIVNLKNDMEKAHEKTEESLRFIKENLFNPHEGLWAETKLNTQFRENTTKWRGVIGVGFVALLVEKVWSMFTGG